MDDHDFLQAFEAGTLDSFPHRSHLRLAWLYIRQQGWEQGLLSIREGIQHFAAARGATRKYHETITCFWAHAVYTAMSEIFEETDFDRFIAGNRYLLEIRLINDFYSPALLQTEAARNKWIEPDLKPLPGDIRFTNT